MAARWGDGRRRTKRHGILRIETPETFDIEWSKVKNDRIFDGDGSKNEQHYAFGEDVLAVADGTVVSVQDGKPGTTPNVSMVPETKDDYGGNHVILEIAPNVFALYVHLHTRSIAVKVGDVVKTGAPLAKIGNTGPSKGPHLHSVFQTSPTCSPDGACLSCSTASRTSARSI